CAFTAQTVRKSGYNRQRTIAVGNFKFVGYLKGKSALMVFDKNPELGSKWDRTFWAKGYYVSTVGNITEDAIKKYIQEQKEEDKRNRA
ncbi:MAG: transposase, partial [Lachnospiraceae bacterium]|nr:transposase [Lachnospiraceae bacterium]